MERIIHISFGATKVPVAVTVDDTIGSIKEKIWSNAPNVVSGYNRSESTLGVSPNCVVHTDQTKIYDIVQWNHLFTIPLPYIEKNESKGSIPSLPAVQARRASSTIDLGLAPGFTGIQPDIYVPELYLVRQLKHKEKVHESFHHDQPHIFARTCQYKTKTFLGYLYETRYIVLQGYTLFIFKSAKDFEAHGAPIELIPIQGQSIFSVDSKDKEPLLVVHAHDSPTQRPSPVAVASILQHTEKEKQEARSGGTNGSGFSTPPGSPRSGDHSSHHNQATPTANLLKNAFRKEDKNSGILSSELVRLSPESHTKQGLIASTFTKTDLLKPPRGFHVFTFDDKHTHTAVYDILRALRYQFVLEVSAEAAMICEKRQYWKHEGMFRLSTSKTDLEDLKRILYNGYAYDLTLIRDEHLFTGLIKTLLRDLPDSPFSSHLYQHWAGIDITHTNWLSHLQQVTRLLPYYRHNFLTFYLLLLSHVATFQDTSRMDARNLAVVFSPNFLVAPIGSDSLQNQLNTQKKLIDLVEKLIVVASSQFVPVNETGKPLRSIVIYDSMGQTLFSLIGGVWISNNSNSNNKNHGHFENIAKNMDSDFAAHFQASGQLGHNDHDDYLPLMNEDDATANLHTLLAHSSSTLEGGSTHDSYDNTTSSIHNTEHGTHRRGSAANIYHVDIDNDDDDGSEYYNANMTPDIAGILNSDDADALRHSLGLLNVDNTNNTHDNQYYFNDDEPHVTIPHDDDDDDDNHNINNPLGLHIICEPQPPTPTSVSQLPIMPAAPPPPVPLPPTPHDILHNTIQQDKLRIQQARQREIDDKRKISHVLKTIVPFFMDLQNKLDDPDNDIVLSQSAIDILYDAFQNVAIVSQVIEHDNKKASP